MTELVLFNTLGRQLAPFRPLVPGQVRIYGCGPTVYNDVHIGNLRAFLFQDLLRRALPLLAFAVTPLMNNTHADDKNTPTAGAARPSRGAATAPFTLLF